MRSFCDASGWRIAWRDEFEGSAIDLTRWNVEVGAPPQNGRGRRAMRADCRGKDCATLGSCREAYCARDDVSVDRGRLVLTSQRREYMGHNFTTGAVNTWGKSSWLAGDGAPFRLCINAILPGVPHRAAGVWPAHWLMPLDDSCDPDEGEMDITEMVNGDGNAYATYHWQRVYPKTKCAFPQGHDHVYAKAILDEGWNATLHEFAVERGRSHVAFAIDGRVLVNSSAAKFFDVAWYLILNTAIGGGWPGPPNASTAFPIRHEIDYVRVARML